MALAGFTIGTGGNPEAGTSPAPTASPTAPVGTSALKGFSIGSQPATPQMTTPAADPQVQSLVASTPVKPPDTAGLFSKFLGVNNFSIPTPNNKTDTTTQAISPKAGDPSLFQKVTGAKFTDVLDGLPQAAKDVSGAINNTIIQKPADLLAKTKFIQEASAGIDAGSTSGLFAQEMLHKLSYGLSSLEGLTGGMYQAPNNPTEDFTDKALKTISTGIGMAVSMSSIGSVASSLPGVSAATEGLTTLANKYPLVAKYIAPYIKPLVQNTIGFATYGQLDPTLAGNMKNRVEKLALDIGTAPLYTALGTIKNAGFSIPASFGLGYGMAKLSGASNQDAIASGFALSLMDTFGRVAGSRGLTPNEIHEKLSDEALKVLNKYSDVKLTKDSSSEEFKKAYRAGAHQTHPDLGGSQEDFISVKNAFDLLSKGDVSNTKDNITEAEKSIATLSGEVKDSVNEHGLEITKQALRENLGLDINTAEKIANAEGKKNALTNPEKLAQNVMDKVAPEEKPLFHGANAETAAQIKASGFKGGEQQLGEGMVSLTENPDIANEYAGPKGEVLKVKSSGQNTKTYSSMDEYENAVENSPGENWKEKETNLNKGFDIVRIKNADSKGNDEIFANPGSLSVVKPEIQALKNFSLPGALAGINLSQQTRLTAEQAKPLADKATTQYWKDKIAPAIKAGKPVIIGGDDLKDHFGGDYNDNNHPVYSQAANALYDQALKESTNSQVVFIGGGPGSGKTELLVNHMKDTDYGGIIYDSNFSNYEGAVRQIEKARAAGKSVDIYGVLPNLEKARGFTVTREQTKGRGITDDTFAHGHTNFPATVQKLLENGIVTSGEVHILDTRNVEGLDKAKALVSTGSYISNPLAILNNLGYNKDNLKQTYGKSNYTKEGVYTGGTTRELQNSKVRKASSETSTEHRANSEREAEREALISIKQDALNNHPAKPLLKYVATRGDNAGGLPEVTGDAKSIFGNEGDSIATENGFADSEAARESVIDYKNKLNELRSLQGGYINIDAIFKDADAKIKNFINSTMKPIQVSENLSDSFAQLEGAAQADLETAFKLVKDLDITKADDEALYHHAEDPSSKLTPHQQELEKKFDEPLKKLNQELYNRIKGDGMILPESDTYISRFPKEKPSVMQRIFNPAKGRQPTAGQGGILSKSAPSLKKRTMKTLVDANGNRTVVAIKDGRVTAFNNKEPIDLGTLTKKVTPKVKEFYDENVTPKLEKLAKDLGITHTRHTAATKGLGGNRAGVSFTGQSKVKTRVATPERVLLHEIGHQIDEKYDLQEIFKKDDARNYGKDTSQKELRALADLRIEGKTIGVDVSKHFAESYIRNGAEKMAVMFEAYLHVPDKFQEVAPNIFEKFEEFLGKHAELRPILDIKPSLTLGSKVIGGEHVGGKNDSTFVDKNGKKYTIQEATTKEIEQHTNLEYHHSALASRLMQYIKLRQIDRANQFLESWKASADFAKVGIPSDEIPPEGWKMTSQQNFRNYFFEPRTAEVLDDMQKKMESGQYNDAFQGINRVLANAIFFNGLAHPINVGVTWAYNRGASSLVLPSAYKSGFSSMARAWKAMREKNDDYMELLKNGAHLMSSDVTNKKLAEEIFKKLSNDLESKPDLHPKIMKALSYAGDQLSFKKNVIYKLSHNMAWLSNDLLTMQAIFENMDRYNMTMKQSIKEVSRFIPDYRQQARLLDKPLSAIGSLVGKEAMGGATARALAKITYNRNISMFGSYHVGLMQSFTNALKDSIGAGKGFGGEDMKSRAHAWDKLAMLALLGLVVYPFLDKAVQKITGSENTYVTRSGILKYPYLAYKWATGQTNTSQAMQSIITPAVGTESMIEMFFNRDLFTGNNIYGVGGEGVDGFLVGKVAPIAEANKVASGKVTPGSFAATLLGVHTPKNNQLGLDLNAMIYTEKPQVAMKVKDHIAAGDEAGGRQIAHEFNQRLSDQIRKADIASGNSGSDARVAYFLNQYGIKMPGQKAMDNYAAKQGKNIIEKVLPNGKPVIVKNTPVSSTGIIGTITTYAKAIGTDPITAFQDIFSGQSIKSVTNGTIIVQRMSLSQSQTDKANIAGGKIPKGMILDHIVPLEASGTNDKSNLQLITTEQDGSGANQPVEDFIGKELKAGRMTGAQGREFSIRFKAGQGQQLTPELLKEYKDKYNSQPITLEEIKNYNK